MFASSQQSCSYLPAELLVSILIIEGIVLLCNIIICCGAIYKFCFKNSDKIILQIRIVCLIGIFSQLATSIASFVFFLDFSSCPNIGGHSLTYVVSSVLIVASASVNVCSVYYLMAIRVKYILKDSIFELSKWVVIYFKVTIIVVSIVCIICVAFGITWIWNSDYSYSDDDNDKNNKNEQWTSGVYALLLLLGNLIYVINFIILIKLFVDKIQLLSKALFANNIKSQRMLYQLTVRTVVCCAIAILSSIGVGTTVIAVGISQSVLVFAIHHWLVSIDTTVNGCCLMLQWPFTQHIYDRLCGKIKCCNAENDAHKLQFNTHTANVN